MDRLTELYGLLDDFCRVFEPVWQRQLLSSGTKRRQWPSTLSLAELMTLVILLSSIEIFPVIGKLATLKVHFITIV
jgi:hypothetical protein